mgnify:FL=1
MQEDLAKPLPTQVEFDEDLPGGGQYPCVPCARHFQSEADLATHLHSKPHKKRLKLLKEPAYTHAEAEAAGGMGSDFYTKNKHLLLAAK